VNAESLVACALLAPVAGGVGILIARRHANLREGVTLLAAAVLLLVVVLLVPPVLDGARPELELFRLLGDIGFTFRIEPLGLLFALLASALWIVSSVYSIGYLRANGEHNQTRFFLCFALAIACTIGIAFAGNLLTLFLFYEALTLVTYPLVAHHQDEAARRGARVYLTYLLGTSMALFLVAIITTWLFAGSIEFTPGGVLGSTPDGVVHVLLALYVFGIGKAAVMPFHRWLPAAMVAPAPVSALLHAVAVVKAGVFAVVKVVIYIFGMERLGALGGLDWLIAVAGFTIVAAAVIALRADNLKRRLAYSTISQLSYVVLAVAVLTPLSVIGAVLHIAAHALGKITLFFAAGAIYTAAHKTEVSELNGIGRRMPWTMGAFAVGAVSLIGLPPAAGFASKWYILQGAMATPHWGAAAVMLVSTLLAAAYLLPIVYRAFLLPPASSDATGQGEAPLPMLLAMVVTAAGVLLLFIGIEFPVTIARLLVP